MKTTMLLPIWRYLAMMFLIAPGICFGQSKVPVVLDTTVGANDNIGRQLVFEIKEAIRGSRGFRLVEDAKQWPYIRHSIVTLPDKNNYQTFVAHTFTYDSVEIPLNGAFITSFVQYCGADVVKQCAATVMGHLDSAVDQLKSLSPTLWKTLR